MTINACMEVVINGVAYAPSIHQRSNIGIAITIYNRQAVLDKALEHQLRYLPPGALVIVIDDGSSKLVTTPDSVRLIRCDMSRCIVTSKNASLEALIDAG